MPEPPWIRRNVAIIGIFPMLERFAQNDGAEKVKFLVKCFRQQAK